MKAKRKQYSPGSKPHTLLTFRLLGLHLDGLTCRKVCVLRATRYPKVEKAPYVL